MIFCSSRPRRTTRRIRGRAVKALRSGRSQLCWRGFESHRMQHLFWFFCCVLVVPEVVLTQLHLCAEVGVGMGWTVFTGFIGHGGASVCHVSIKSFIILQCLMRSFSYNSKEASTSQANKKRLWRYRDSSPGQADHNRLC